MKDKLKNLKNIIEGYKSAVVAFSGGVDSTFLLKICADVLERDSVLAVTAQSLVVPPREITEAQKFAASLGIRHEILEFDELSVAHFASNMPDRCYYCKKAIFGMFLDKAAKYGLMHVFDGSNLDDVGDFRPGMRALRELSIKSPLREAKLAKNDIRILSRGVGLNTWDKPSLACLASRIPYGEEITAQKLQRVRVAEEVLRGMGFSQFRVRSHEDIARIEVPPDEMDKFLKADIRKNITSGLIDVGFKYITLDLEGYRTGSMNEVLEEGEKSAWKI